MVPGGPWHIAGQLPEELREVFQKSQAASYKQQAASCKLDKQQAGWYKGL